MDFAEWPGIVDAVEGWFNQPMPAKTATMWYAELRHYDGERVLEAFRKVATGWETPFLPPLGVILRTVRTDKVAIQQRHDRFTRQLHSVDQFLLTEGGPDEEGDDDGLARGLICGTAGCGYTPVLDPGPGDRCPECGGRYVLDGHVLAQGQDGATAQVV